VRLLTAASFSYFSSRAIFSLARRPLIIGKIGRFMKTIFADSAKNDE
jgi:hypothetical protein